MKMFSTGRKRKLENTNKFQKTPCHFLWTNCVVCLDIHLEFKIILLGIISIVCVAMTSGKTDSLPNHEEDSNPLFLSVKQIRVTGYGWLSWLLMTVPLCYQWSWREERHSEWFQQLFKTINDN